MILHGRPKYLQWTSRLWVGRRKEAILNYVTKNDEEKNPGSKGLSSYENYSHISVLYTHIIYIQGVTEIQVQNGTMPIKTENKTFYKNDKKRLTA